MLLFFLSEPIQVAGRSGGGRLYAAKWKSVQYTGQAI